MSGSSKEHMRSFDLCLGKQIPKRNFNKADMDLFLRNAEVIWGHVVAVKPTLLVHVELALHDRLLDRDIEIPMRALFDSTKIDEDRENCIRYFLKLCVVLLCVTTTVSTAETLLKYERVGTFIGLLDLTARVLYQDSRPIPFDVQMAFISSVVWEIGVYRGPTRMAHTNVETLALLDMESDADLRDVLVRLSQASSRVKVTLN